MRLARRGAHVTATESDADDGRGHAELQRCLPVFIRELAQETAAGLRLVEELGTVVGPRTQWQVRAR